MGYGQVQERWDPGEYRKCGIRASTGNVKSGRVPKKVGSGLAPEMWDPGEYREGKIRVSTGKGRIRASTRNVGSGQVAGEPKTS